MRTIAVARILMPESVVRLSAGRTAMSDEMQALCFFAGANSIFVGDTAADHAQPREDERDRPDRGRLGMASRDRRGHHPAGLTRLRRKSAAVSSAVKGTPAALKVSAAPSGDRPR